MKLVLADDHRLVREGLRWMLSNEPDIQIVGEVSDGSELIQCLEDRSADIVLLDIRMPGMNGIEALGELSRVSPSTRVVILSMHDEPAVVRKAIELGASGYLLKSVARDELLKALSVVGNGGSYIHGEVTGPLVAEVAGSTNPTHLSPRKQQVLELVAEGYENKQIAFELGVSQATVKTYLRSIFAELDVQSRAEAVAVALRTGLIE